jgi:hypothetical protein
LLPGFLQGTFGSESSEFSPADKERVLRRARMGHLTPPSSAAAPPSSAAAPPSSATATSSSAGKKARPNARKRTRRSRESTPEGDPLNGPPDSSIPTWEPSEASTNRWLSAASSHRWLASAMGAAVFLTWDPQAAEALEVLGAPLFSAMFRVLLRARCPSPSLADQWAFYLLSGTVEWTSALPKAATRAPTPPGALPSLLALPGDLVSLDASGRFYTVSSVDNGIASLKQSGDHRVFVVPTVYLFVRRRAQANAPHRPKGPRPETGLPCNCGRADGGSGRHTDACASRVSTKACQSRRLGTAEANASFLARTADRLRPVEP